MLKSIRYWPLLTFAALACTADKMDTAESEKEEGEIYR